MATERRNGGVRLKLLALVGLLALLGVVAALVVLAVGRAPVARAAESEVACGLPWGDSNLDGVFNASDMSLLLAWLLGPPPTMPLPGTPAFIVTDVNGDLVLDFMDFMLFQMRLDGSISSFPVDTNGNDVVDCPVVDGDNDGVPDAEDNCPDTPGLPELQGCPALFLVIDEDSIDNGNPPNFFSDMDVNDHIADIGLRAQLPFFASNPGATIVLHTGQVGDEGWFALKTIPASWAAAGPTADGLRNYLVAGPGLGTPDANGDREALLDKVPDVTPLRATGLKLLEGQGVCAVVYDSDISINYDPLNGSLKGANLGIVAFEVISVTELTGFSSSSLPKVTVEILDAEEVCEGPLEEDED